MNIFRLKSNSLSKKVDVVSGEESDCVNLPKPVAAVSPNPTRSGTNCDGSNNNDASSKFIIDESDLWEDDENEDELFLPDKKKCAGKDKDDNEDEHISDDSESVLENRTQAETEFTCDFDLLGYDDYDDHDDGDYRDSKSSPKNSPSPCSSKNFDDSYDVPKKTWKNIQCNEPVGSACENEEDVSKLLNDSSSLDIDGKIKDWIEETLQNEAFTSPEPDAPKSVLERNLNFIRNRYIELLEKVSSSFEKIPVQLLKRFPGFDPDVFTKLKTTRNRMKALMIRTNIALERHSSKDEDEPFTVETRLNTEKSPVTDAGPFKLTSTETVTRLTQSPSNSAGPFKLNGTDVIDYTNAIYTTPGKDKNSVKSSLRDDSKCGAFDGFNFPHSSQIRTVLSQKFGLKTFRPNQLQVINAALLGHDCFVLMPTGGGKSLCYQLPAIISPGVTVVISPLRSLILDQVTKMLTLDIPAAHLSGDMTDSESRVIYNKLNQREPTIKLLYVTPEKVGSSMALRSCFTGLYKRGMLARFVIDEVHCVSQWGHDFRPDYKKLYELRENYPGVKIMALTATATPRVRTDILHQLRLLSPKWFLSSFNRSNLVYSVREKKGKSVIKEIAELIKKEYKKETGVIYCFSRKECEDVAKELKMFGVDAVAYHAGLDDKNRTKVQNMWMNDKVKVVCATIAFGMGVDKLDVRFVIHYSIPKSIEGYYQESGRAGRDGLKATCILYYCHRDKLRMLKLINMDQAITNEAARRIHVDNLFRVVAYAENKTDCRRALQLEYLGEKFDKTLCIENKSTACDNCLELGCYNTIDVTEESKAIVSAVKSICGRSNFTMLHFVDIFKGATSKKVLAEGHNNLPMYGLGKAWLRLDVERLFRKLIMKEYLTERLQVKDEGISFAYLKTGPLAEDLLRGKVKIQIDIKKSNTKKAGPSSSSTSKTSVDPVVLEIQEKCYAVLMDVIKGIAEALNCNPNAIMNIQAIRLMSQILPESPEEMLSINHVTEANFEKYGAALLDVTKQFAREKRERVAAKAPVEARQESEPLWPETEHKESRYFGVEFVGAGKKRKRRNNYQKWQYAKKAKTGKGRGQKKNPNPEGITTVPLAKFSTLMELPVKKSSTAPRSTLRNL